MADPVNSGHPFEFIWKGAPHPPALAFGHPHSPSLETKRKLCSGPLEPLSPLPLTLLLKRVKPQIVQPPAQFTTGWESTLVYLLRDVDWLEMGFRASIRVIRIHALLLVTLVVHVTRVVGPTDAKRKESIWPHVKSSMFNLCLRANIILALRKNLWTIADVAPSSTR